MRRFAFVFLFLVSCGGAGAAKEATSVPKKESPSSESTSEPPKDGDGIPDGAAGKKKVEGESGSKMVDVPSAERAFDDASKAFAAAGSDCVSMCKALQSMARATERLCELAGNGPDATRCADAKSKLESARAKVKTTCGGACE